MSNQAYVAGVLHGDGWLTEQTIGLKVSDKDFCEAFAYSVSVITGVALYVRLDERGYWLTRSSNKTGCFNGLKDFEPRTDEEKTSWIRGLFDSEGNAQLSQVNGVRSYLHRRVSIYSTDTATLDRAKSYLADLGIDTRLRATSNSESHIGDRVVYELAVREKDGFIQFADLIGSSLVRKRERLIAIRNSFVADGYQKTNQLKGAAAKRRKTLTVRLPAVVNGIRELIDRGVKPTQRNCRSIPSYGVIQKLFPQSHLVELAMQETAKCE
jgi:hypothetical protein